MFKVNIYTYDGRKECIHAKKHIKKLFGFFIDL